MGREERSSQTFKWSSPYRANSDPKLCGHGQTIAGKIICQQNDTKHYLTMASIRQWLHTEIVAVEQNCNISQGGLAQ